MPWFPTKARVAYTVVGEIFMRALRRRSQVVLDFSHRFRACARYGKRQREAQSYQVRRADAREKV